MKLFGFEMTVIDNMFCNEIKDYDIKANEIPYRETFIVELMNGKKAKFTTLNGNEWLAIVDNYFLCLNVYIMEINGVNRLIFKYTVYDTKKAVHKMSGNAAMK